MKCALDFTMTGKSIPFETELLDYSISEEDEAQNEDEEAARARVIDAMRSKFGPVDEGCNLDEQ